MAGAEVRAGSEAEVLRACLDRQRDAVLWKLEGLGDDELRRPLTPTGTNLLGLVQHLASVEYGWLCETFGREAEPFPFDPDDPDADLRIAPGVSTESVLAYYARARAAADATMAEVDLDTVGRAAHGPVVSLRWAVVHLIEETARHAGHADILRELIDGVVGERRPAG